MQAKPLPFKAMIVVRSPLKAPIDHRLEQRDLRAGLEPDIAVGGGCDHAGLVGRRRQRIGLCPGSMVAVPGRISLAARLGVLPTNDFRLRIFRVDHHFIVVAPGPLRS